MQESLTFPTLQEQQLGSPPRFTFPELLHNSTTEHNFISSSACCSELSSSTSTPFVSAPSSPTRSKAFNFSAPTSPSWPQRTLIHSQEKQGFDFHYVWPSHLRSSGPSSHDDDQQLASFPLYTHQHGSTPSSEKNTHINWAQPSGHGLQSSAAVEGERIDSLQADSCSFETEHHGSSHQKAHHTRSSSNWAPQSLHTRSSSSQKALHIRQRTSSWSPQSFQTTEHHIESSPFVPQKSYQTEYERSPNSLEAQHPSRSSPSSHKPLQSHHGRSPSWAQQRPLQPDLQTEHATNPSSLQIKHLQAANSNLSQHPHPIFTDFANHKVLKRLQVEDSDASYSRQSFYASAVPFSWEEKPGTPKARSITSEASNGEDDSPSNLLSGSSEFEFSARFSELEDPPMSPTPISSTFNSFKHQYAYGSPSPTHKHTYHTHPGMQNETVNEEQIWPLRPPPRLDNPVSWKQPVKDEGNELKRSHGSLASLSAPQSPRSLRMFDIRGALCGILSPVDAVVVDPFVAAMEKSMAKNGDDLANEEMGKSRKKKTNRYSNGHHRRTQSLSPLRVFHWDDHSAKSNSSSNGSSSNMDEIKNKHPIHREIIARHSAGTPKGSKKWNFKDFLHRKSVSGGESTARHSNTSASLRSSGRESCSSSGTARDGQMDASYVEENVKIRGANSPSVVASVPSTPSSILSASSSNNSSKGKLSTSKSNKGPYALHYSMQRAHTEELRKKTFLPYKQGLLGCLGISSKSYRALASLSKPLQSVS